jgi:hypothetical protein
MVYNKKTYKLRIKDSAMSSIQLDQLAKEMQSLYFLEAIYPLHCLYFALKNSKKKNDEAVIEIARSLVQDLTCLINPTVRPTPDQLIAKMSSINQSLELLKKETKVGNLTKQVKKAVLDAIGFITGVLCGSLLGLNMVFMGLRANHKLGLNTPGNILRYFGTGFLMGAIVARRFVCSFENDYDRQMRYVNKHLQLSFNSLKKTIDEIDNLTIQKSVLDEILGEEATLEERDNFLGSEQEYSHIGFKAGFLTADLKGFVGHHATLVFSIEGKDHIIELGSPSTQEVKDPDQKNGPFKCTGKKIVEMLVMDKIIKEHYSWYRFVQAYRAGDYDCHTYIDTILASVGEPLSTLDRSTAKDNSLGKGMVSILKRCGTFAERSEKPNEIQNLAVQNPSPSS